jgi:hypothetical protein
MYRNSRDKTSVSLQAYALFIVCRLLHRLERGRKPQNKTENGGVNRIYVQAIGKIGPGI